VSEDTARGIRVVDDERQRPARLGTFVQRNGGETSSPSQLSRLGIGWAFSKALLSSANSAISR